MAQRHAGLYLLRYHTDHTAATSKTNMTKITVKIEDGTVQTIDRIPTDVTVEVRNYDVSAVDAKLSLETRTQRAAKFVERHAPE